MSATLATPEAARHAATMQAIRIHEFGPPEVMQLVELPRPQPGPGEVLLRIQAAGVGPWDAWIRAGRSALPQPLPLTLGSDAAGVVEQIGPGVTSFKPGDEVFGLTSPRFTGGYASHAVVAATGLAHRPASLSPIEAASVPVIAVTAWQALFEHARLQPGQTVLIHGAAGNVGAYAVQLAASAGIRVLATASAADLDAVRRLGAAAAFDHRTARFEELAGPVDAVIDLVGGEAQTRSFPILRRGGVLISAVAPPDQALARRHRVRASFFLVEVTTARLTRLAGMFAVGMLSPQVGAVLPMAEARTAHEMLEGRLPKPRGKIVLRVG
jgi:NADPH:quinone reductase-like Zn-dependent oxidoreductase